MELAPHDADVADWLKQYHRRNVDEKPGRILSWLLPEKTPFDPDDPQSFDEALPEPGAFLDRLFREPFMMAESSFRQIRSRGRKQLKASR